MAGRSRRGDSDEGAAAVELALVLPVVLSVCFFALYGAMYFFYNAVADHVARTVVRQVAVPSASGAYPATTTSALAADAKAAAGTLLPNPSSATVSPITTTPAEGDLVTVTVTYKLPLIDQLASVIPGVSSIDTISSSATERRQ